MAPDSPTDQQLPSPVQAGPLTLEISADATTGYAAIQNHIPVARAVLLHNRGPLPLSGITLTVSCAPAFAQELTLRFAHLGAGETRRIAPLDLQPEHAWLCNLNESVHAAINVHAQCDGVADVTVTQQIEVLAYDQWAGARALPELLAAFCMPNSPVIDGLLGAASRLLREAQVDTGMDGYQSASREAAWQQVSALYSSVRSLDLHYANPPASFGADGQKIRTPERIVESKVATCLDLAMLLASALEQCGLHPVVLVQDGHAWVGVWLVDTCFPTALVDDVQAVRKRVKSGELLVFETTGLAAAHQATLRASCLAGEELLDQEASFAYAIDIRRARELQIRPLPSRAAPGMTELGEQSCVVIDAPGPALEAAPPLPPLDAETLAPGEPVTPDTPDGRLARWKSKLLDLTLRNRLLNFKPSRTNLRVLCPNLAALEDTLAEGIEFRLRAAPPVMRGADTRDAGVFNARNGAQAVDALASDALGRHEILLDCPEESLEARLLEMFRAAGTGLEEGGANTLFLSFGMLEWRDAEAPNQPAEASHLAPILLIPVTLSRQSVRSGFRLIRHDDEALVNPTLIQKLWQDFSLKLPSFEQLPLDDKGLDVERILQTFRLHVAELQGWEVKEQVHLGIFSFTKYLMWKDLQSRHDQLQNNPVVAHLINHPGQAMARGELGFEPATLDASHRPQDLFAPLLSDSSQLRAICVASSGTNLVIEGPPGTGKSQTITNLIAHLLATGKKVLFVSEKMAALEVVQRRLSSIGLGAFCLELHSSKAKKADVLKQLGTALDVAGVRTVKEWDIEAARLLDLRGQLNALAAALHRPHPNDLTIFDAIGSCIEHAALTPARLDWSDPHVHTRAQLDALREHSRQMATLAAQLGALAGHPLGAIARTQWTPSWQQELQDGAAQLDSLAERLQEAVAAPMAIIGMDGSSLTLDDLAAFDELAASLLAAASFKPAIPLGVARNAHEPAALACLARLRRHGAARGAAWAALNGQYRDDAASLDAAQLRVEWAAAQNLWWPKSWFARRSLLARLQPYRLDLRRPSEAEAAALLAALAAVNAEDQALAALAPDAGALLDDGFAAHRTDWAALEAAEHWAGGFARVVLRLAGGDSALARALQAALQPFVCEDRAMLRPEGTLGAALFAYRDAYQAFFGQLAQVSQLVANESAITPNLGLDANAGAVLPRLSGMLRKWQGAMRQLQPWCLWQGARARAAELGLSGMVNALENGTVPLQDSAAYFEYSYRNWWVRKMVDREPVLCGFSSADHERKIDEFRQADARFQQLTQQYVAARLAGQIPAAAGVAPSADSEMGKLRRELQKQRKHMPIRQLVQSLPTLLPTLKPCLLMSPLSVAQYLDAAHPQFDVVIFDEASQIPVWDAIGAIARGRQLVCVGDPKQLPPTSFFGRTEDAEAGDDNEVQDLESILDECLGIGMPQLRLNWHYRSRHESLIAFSNVTYYDSALVTFPSPLTADRAVRFQHVPGVYDRGGARTNRAEAEAIAAAIESHYLDPLLRRQSVGVVTFNQAQQSLVERLLDARRRANPALDAALAAQVDEALFIKNLENVQGDERDLIFFSITYGPDAAGKVSLNFGPLNLEGGHRRLNVAISRARQGVVVYSTLLPEQIDLARVRASGVRDLKHYLEFAQRGARALVEQSVPTGAEPDSPFERQVSAVLRRHGWTVHAQVGVSGYRIDIGVVDPRAPGRYLLGVECDGRSYHSGATARDRDRLRQHVLSGLGWELQRIWSTDWWLDPEQPTARLLARLDALMAAPLEQPAALPPSATRAESLDAALDAALDETPEDTPAAADTGAPAALPCYRISVLAPGDPERFFDPASAGLLTAQLRQVIAEEGPVARQHVLRRVSRAWGLARLGARIEKHLDGLLPAGSRHSTEDGAFLWPEGVAADQWEGFRVCGAEPESRRAVEEVALAELGNLALYALRQGGSMPQAALVRAVCQLLGIKRAGAEAEARIAQAFSCGQAARLIRIENAMVSLQRPE